MTDCARGCIARGRHRSACEGGGFQFVTPPDDLFNADRPNQDRHKYWIRFGAIETWQDCAGCLPRQASHGVLCDPDHNRLVSWLTGHRGLVWIHGWLGQNLPRGGTSAARQDWQRPGGKDGQPLPIREVVHDLRVKLAGRVLEVDEQIRDEFDRPARDTPFALGSSCSFIHAWLTKAECVEHLALHIYELFDEVMRDARVLCPWDDRPRPILGIACPHCEVEALARFPGEESVTCRGCWASIPSGRYEIWVRMLAQGVAS